MAELHPDVTDPDQYDGRDFVGKDNTEGVSDYVGVDPVYQTYANEGEKPYPFSDEELDAAAERGGLDLDAEAEAKAARSEGDEDSADTSKKVAPKKTAAPKAPVPAQRPTSEK